MAKAVAHFPFAPSASQQALLLPAVALQGVLCPLMGICEYTFLHDRQCHICMS